MLGPWEARGGGGQVLPHRKGGAGWGHLAGAWEPDDFTGLSMARKLDPSEADDQGTAAPGCVSTEQLQGVCVYARTWGLGLR